MRAALAGLMSTWINCVRWNPMRPWARRLGRLAACFMESWPHSTSRLRLRHPLRPRPVPSSDEERLASKNSPRIGCRSATPGNSTAKVNYDIGFGGSIEVVPISEGRSAACSAPRRTIEAVAYDTHRWLARPSGQYLRLWTAPRCDPLKLEAFITATTRRPGGPGPR